MNNILHPLARFLVALIFLLSGIGKVFGFADTTQMMTDAGFPAPSFFLAGAIVLELVGGAFLLFGYKTRYAAVALMVFIIPATIIFHASGIGDPVHGQEQMINTLKNLAILGALLKFAADGAGAFAVDNFFGATKNDLPQSEQAALYVQ
ncbi:MAG: DoxX family protein [Acidobacteriota bacterium]|nr:DoxX family protein [Acidobacteriota bacterium]